MDPACKEHRKNNLLLIVDMQTVKQLMAEFADPKRLVLLDDCMSDVPGFGAMARPIYDRARKLGVHTTTSRHLDLS